jgi:hypothetical protein
MGVIAVIGVMGVYGIGAASSLGGANGAALAIGESCRRIIPTLAPPRLLDFRDPHRFRASQS